MQYILDNLIDLPIRPAEYIKGITNVKLIDNFPETAAKTMKEFNRRVATATLTQDIVAKDAFGAFQRNFDKYMMGRHIVLGLNNNDENKESSWINFFTFFLFFFNPLSDQTTIITIKTSNKINIKKKKKTYPKTENKNQSQTDGDSNYNYFFVVFDSGEVYLLLSYSNPKEIFFQGHHKANATNNMYQQELNLDEIIP